LPQLMKKPKRIRCMPTQSPSTHRCPATTTRTHVRLHDVEWYTNTPTFRQLPIAAGPLRHQVQSRSLRYENKVLRKQFLFRFRLLFDSRIRT
jgi:hypothetical protein